MTAALSLWEARPVSPPAAAGEGLETYRRVRDIVLRLVGRNRRVLELVGPSGLRLSGLKNQGCQVVSLAYSPQVSAIATAPGDEVIQGDLERLVGSEVLGKDVFDVVIAVDALEHVPDPGHVLRALHGCLRGQGCLIASVPNVAHGSIRLALWQGRFPGSDGTPEPTPLRFYTRESLFQLLEATQFAVGHLERLEAGFEPAGVSADLLRSLDHDLDARTSQFVVVAYPLPSETMNYLQERLRDMVLARDELCRQEAELQQKLLDLEDQLARRDTALQQSLRELSIQRDRREFFEARINRIWNSLPMRVARRLRKLVYR